jgi:hypothetical protein
MQVQPYHSQLLLFGNTWGALFEIQIPCQKGPHFGNKSYYMVKNRRTTHKGETKLQANKKSEPGAMVVVLTLGSLATARVSPL